MERIHRLWRPLAFVLLLMLHQLPLRAQWPTSGASASTPLCTPPDTKASQELFAAKMGKGIKLTPSEEAVIECAASFASKCDGIVMGTVVRVVRSDPSFDPKNFPMLSDICAITLNAELKNLSDAYTAIQLKPKYHWRLELYRECFLAAENFMLAFDHFTVRYLFRVNDYQETSKRPWREFVKPAERLTFAKLKSDSKLADKVIEYMVRSPYFADDILRIAENEIPPPNNHWTSPMALSALNALKQSQAKSLNYADVEMHAQLSPQKEKQREVDREALRKNELVNILNRAECVKYSNGPLNGVRIELLKLAAATPGFLLSGNLLILPEYRFERLNEMKDAGNRYPHLIERSEKLSEQLLEQMSDVERIGDLIAIRVGQSAEEQNLATNILADQYSADHDLFWEGQVQQAYQELLEAWNGFKVARSRVMW